MVPTDPHLYDPEDDAPMRRFRVFYVAKEYRTAWVDAESESEVRQSFIDEVDLYTYDRGDDTGEYKLLEVDEEGPTA